MSQRSRRSFLQISAASAGAFACLLACGGGGSNSTEGTLVLRTGGQVSGTTYRLSGATFEVSGAETLSLSTGNPPQANALQSSLEPGQYSVRLMDGWVLEQQMGANFTPVTGATLSSMNPVNVNVVRGQVATVGFVFNTGMVMVDLAQAVGGDDDGSYD